MSSLYEDIMQGLNEAIAYERGTGTARVTKMTRRIEPLPKYTADEIRRIRIGNDMTQRAFAEFMGVSVKTVEAWERGRNEPNGSAARLMQVITKHKGILSPN